jgi:hypothetical protein
VTIGYITLGADLPRWQRAAQDFALAAARPKAAALSVDHAAALHCYTQEWRGAARTKPEIHRVDPRRVWVNSKALIGIFSQTAGSTCEFWVNPVNFTF